MIVRLALLSLLTAVAVSAADLTVVRVYTGWRDAASFKRISEYFDGKENTGGEAVVRTHPEERAGFYYLVRLTNPGAPRAITAKLQVITSANGQPTPYAFPVSLATGDTVFHLGLTGADWTDPKLHPVAWKIDFTDGEGRVLASQASYLWEKPAAN